MNMARSASLVTIVAALCHLLVTAEAGPINSDVAFTPREGGGILRLQYTFSEADGHGAVRHVSASRARVVLAYGVTSRFAAFLNVPYLNRQVDRFDRKLGRSEEAHDGLGDVTVLAKYRFWQKDLGPGRTLRLAALGGLNIRSGDSDFTSDSYDPILGTVISWRGGRSHLDADLIYQFNTGGGEARHDSLRYDAAYTYRVYPAVYATDQPYEVVAVAELNGRYSTDGSHEIFLSPGVQLVMEQWSFELSIQLPAVQDLADDGPETNYRFVVGLRYRW